MNRLLLTLAAAWLAIPAWANPSEQQAALHLATAAGCMACHHTESHAQGAGGLPPLGPAWRDVATRYSSVKGAQQQLTAIVMAGTSPHDSHWKHQVGTLPMPPNKVAITEVDAARIVAWILSLRPLDN